VLAEFIGFELAARDVDVGQDRDGKQQDAQDEHIPEPDVVRGIGYYSYY